MSKKTRLKRESVKKRNGAISSSPRALIKDPEKGKRIMSIIQSLAKERGFHSENLVEKALIRLKEDGFIRGYDRFDRYSKQDHQGIDFRIWFFGGEAIEIQVKSSQTFAKKFEEVSKSFEKIIPVVVVDAGDDIENVCEKIKRVCKKESVIFNN